MKKRIADVTFEEFDRWANEAILSIYAIRNVLGSKPLFEREKEWEELKKVCLNVDAEIEV